MRKKIFQWLGREFVALSSESDDMEQVFCRFDEALHGMGLSLGNTVRTRLWARNQESRHEASDIRFKVLSNEARASSASFISQDRFFSEAPLGLDLIAMRPPKAGIKKKVVEYDPPKRPCRYVIYDSLVFLTGEEAETDLEPPDLEGQLNNILSVIGDSLAHAGATWNQAVKVSSFLHRNQNLAGLQRLLEKHLTGVSPCMDYVFVDGFAVQKGVPGGGEGVLEVEVTAHINR